MDYTIKLKRKQNKKIKNREANVAQSQFGMG